MINYHTKVIVYLILDIDECRTGTHNCEQVCVNTEGSYSCECFSGHELGSDKRTCNGKPKMTTSTAENYFKYIAINECLTDTHGCEQECVNTDDSYRCECRSGYELKRDQRTCKGKLILNL